MKWLVAIGFLALLTFPGCDRGSKAKTADAPDGSKRGIGTVDLTVDFGSEGGEKKPIDVAVVCSEDSTVLSILERAHNTGDLDLKFRGSGETAFVESISGVKNEGAGGQNWIFRVNGKTGDKSAGVYEVNPGDKVSWQFGELPEELLNP